RLLAGMLLLAGCGADAGGAGAPPVARDERPAHGDTYIESTIGNISALIPNIANDGASHDVGAQIYSGLVTYDKELKVAPELAESWSFSADCRDLTFRLRPNVRWHDGKPFTSADVLFTHATMTHPKTPTAYREDFLAVESIEAPDPLTVKIRYKTPYAKGLQSWSMYMLPKHLLEPYVDAGTLREAPQNRTAPIGTGPYRFKEWKSGEKVVLVANPDYYVPERPYIGRIVYRVIPSQATIFLELKAKGVDAASLTALQYKRQTEYPAFRKAYNRYRYPSNSVSYLAFNGKDPRFADKRVRRALAHAINKQDLIDHVILGLGRDATGPYKPGTWAYNPAVQSPAYDPARARALLAEAGWREKNAAGILVKDGRPFAFEILTNQGNDERKKVAEVVQAALRDIGIDVEIRMVEWATLLKEHVRKRNYDALVLGWGLGRDPDVFSLFHSSKTRPEDFNITSYANPEVDELLERGRSTCIQAERARFYHRVHEILADEVPVLFLYARDALPVVTSRMRGVEPAPAGIQYNFHEWYVPRELQRYTAG
ncbi:MAG: peptide-binding protein, partial [Candidatus Rokubacteria bacterium]|nr:peptide-binding protein [Candidatus Rokubacteria bacterium]